VTTAEKIDRAVLDTQAVVRFLLHEPTRITRLMMRHVPERGLCYACSQRGVPWPCVPVTLASTAARALQSSIIVPIQRRAAS